jgi:hypothetical protein
MEIIIERLAVMEIIIEESLCQHRCALDVI